MDREQIKHTIAEIREQIQNDLQCVMDGFDNKLIDDACQVIVTRMNALSIILTTEELVHQPMRRGVAANDGSLLT